MQNSKSTLRLVASVMFFIAAVSALWGKTIIALQSIGYIQDLGVLSGLFGLQYFSAELLYFPGAMALGIIGVLQGKERLLLWGSISFWVYCVPLVYLSSINISGFGFLISYPLEVLLGDNLANQSATLGLTAATALVVLSSRVPEAHPIEGSVNTTSSGQGLESPMPILALIGAFVFPIIGIILGHLSLSQMRAGTMSPRNRGFAQAGLFIGYLLTAIALFLVLWVVWAIVSWQNSYY